jgi:hypothetical protein
MTTRATSVGIEDATRRKSTTTKSSEDQGAETAAMSDNAGDLAAETSTTSSGQAIPPGETTDQSESGDTERPTTVPGTSSAINSVVATSTALISNTKGSDSTSQVGNLNCSFE